MKAIRDTIIAGLLLVTVAVRAETVETRIGKLDFELGVPTKEAVAKLYDEMDFQRACQLYLWGLPAVGGAQAILFGDVTTGVHNGVSIFEGYRILFFFVRA